MLWPKKIIHFLAHHWSVLSYLILLIITFVYFTFFQAIPAFADPDSFYHTKMSLLISQQGIIKNFPWLQFTILKDSFIDQHFLYHVFLIPFTQTMDPIQGAKLANVFLSVGLILVFYWFLRRQKIKFTFLFTVILLVTMPFIFRVNLVKAPVFSILILLLGLYFLFKYKYLALFILSFFYVWAYGGFILILVFSGIYAVVSLFYDWWQKKPSQKFMLILSHSREVKLFFISLFGIVAGLVVNPHFPHNIFFYWHQLVKIGIINYQKVIPVGNEWYPYKFIDLTAGSAIVSIILLISFYLLVVNYKKPSKKLITLFIIFIFFFVFTLKSSRYVEYYVPFALIFGAFALNNYLGRIDWVKLWAIFSSFYMRHRIVTTILIIYFLATLPTVIIKDIRHTYSDLKGGIKIDRFQKASSWLEENSQAGDIVFHSSWDEFPILFYFNSKNYYIAGLDPTFTYEYDKDLYKKMVDITLGNQKENLYEDIKKKFNSSYVLVEKGHTAMNTNIQADDGFKQVYEDEEATVYQVL